MAAISSSNDSDGSKQEVVLPLSPADAVMGAFRLMPMYIYPPPAEGNAAFDLERLHESFQALIEREYRIFLGTFHVDPATGVASIRQSPETAAPGVARAIPFEKLDISAIENGDAVGDADANAATNSHCGRSRRITTKDALEMISTEFVPARSATQPIAVKATLLSDGGLVLGINMSHSMLDGEGLFTFMKVWGEFYRGVAEHERTKVNHDRSLLASKSTGGGARLPHPEYRVRASAVAKPLQGSSPPATAFPATRRHVFHISVEQMKRIKAVASGELRPDDDSASSSAFVSTIDSVTALFVLLITQARGHGKDVRLVTAVNARKRFSPPLPDNYAGNAVFNALSIYTAQELETVSAAALQTVARRVRQSITHCSDEFLRDAIEFIAASDNIADVLVGTDFFFGPDLVLTSWANCGMYDADFGARPWFVGVPADIVRDGFLLIYEGIRGAGGLEIVVQLEASVMARLLELYESNTLWH